jgi:Transposase, Mutator family
MTKTTAIDPKLVDQLLETYQQPEDLLGENGLLKQLTRALLERALEAEMTHHLGHDHGESVNNERGNKRNGVKAKTVQAEFGQLEIEVPLDPNHAPDGQGRPATATAASNRNWSRNARRDYVAWTRESSTFTRRA